MKFCLFLDFDGVLFDTVKESYAICLSMFNQELDIDDISFDTEHYLAFRKHRYLVAPAWNYKYLLECLKEGGEIDVNFIRKVSSAQTKEYGSFEQRFFEQRQELKARNYEKWLGLNTTFAFFHTVKNWIDKTGHEVYVVTTKDKETVLNLLRLHSMNMNSKKVLDKVDYRQLGSKSSMINKVVNSLQVTHGVFIDDSAFHVKNVKKYSDVSVMLPSWGYVSPGEKGEDLEEIIEKIDEMAKCTA